MKYKVISTLTLLIISILLCTNLFAGVSGTIRGTVTDKETGKPLQGVNIMLKDTKLGTITDEKGFYVITNVPIGRYTVKAMMMGYRPKNITGLVVAIDHQTKLDITLEETTLDIGAEVTVTAEKQMLQQEITSTTHITRGEELNFMPVKDFKDALKREPGVVGGHIRGGRESEVLYLVDDIPIEEAIYGETGANLPNSSVVEMSLQTGGFSAEYGNAMSGVVSVVTKEGNESLHGYIKAYTDYVGDKSDHLQKYELNAGGPLLDQKLGYFVSGDFTMSGTRWRERLEDHVASPIMTNYNINGKLTTNITPSHKLVFQGIVSHQNWIEYEHKWKYHLSGLPEKENNSYRASLTYTHTLSPKTFYKLSLSQFYVMDQILGKNDGNFQPYLGKYTMVAEDPYDLEYFVRSTDGSDLVKPTWRDSEQSITIAKGDFTSQISRYTQMKLGAEGTYYDLYMNNVEYRLIHPDSILPGFPPEEAYNIYITQYNYYPKAGAAYLQFKSEALQDVTLNYGVRFDFLDPTASRPAVEFDFDKGKDPYDPSVVKNEKTVDADFKYQFSPRLGISMPVTDKDKISFNYGHFFQFPLFSYLYTNADYDFSGMNSILGNPDLKSEKTIAYEVSWEHLFTEDMKIDITYFNKDIENLIDKVTFYVESQDTLGHKLNKPFQQYRNLSYGHSYGVEFFLEKRHGITDWWNLPTSYLSGKISYTWMHSKGSSSQFGTQYDPKTGNITVPPYEYYLSWDQRHTLTASLDYRVPEEWGVNVLYRYNSGKPYTSSDGDKDPNSERKDPTSYFDMKANKNFFMGPFKTSIFAEVLNLFDKKNVEWVDSEGRPGGIYEDPTAYDVGRRINVGVTAEF